MLMGSETIPSSQIELNLYFDDNTIKSQIINIGTKLKITYFKGKDKFIKEGIVKRIRVGKRLISCRDDYERYLALRRPRGFDNYEMARCDVHDKDTAVVAILSVDFSKEYNNDLEDIETTDIVDIELLQDEERMELQNMYNTALTVNNKENQYTEESFEYFAYVMTLTKMVLDETIDKNTGRFSDLENKFVSVDILKESNFMIIILNDAIMKLEPTPEESDDNDTDEGDKDKEGTDTDDNTETDEKDNTDEGKESGTDDTDKVDEKDNNDTDDSSSSSEDKDESITESGDESNG